MLLLHCPGCSASVLESASVRLLCTVKDLQLFSVVLCPSAAAAPAPVEAGADPCMCPSYGSMQTSRARAVPAEASLLACTCIPAPLVPSAPVVPAPADGGNFDVFPPPSRDAAKDALATANRACLESGSAALASGEWCTELLEARASSSSLSLKFRSRASRSCCRFITSPCAPAPCMVLSHDSCPHAKAARVEQNVCGRSEETWSLFGANFNPSELPTHFARSLDIVRRCALRSASATGG